MVRLQRVLKYVFLLLSALLVSPDLEVVRKLSLGLAWGFFVFEITGYFLKSEKQKALKYLVRSFAIPLLAPAAVRVLCGVGDSMVFCLSHPFTVLSDMGEMFGGMWDLFLFVVGKKQFDDPSKSPLLSLIILVFVLYAFAGVVVASIIGAFDEAKVNRATRRAA